MKHYKITTNDEQALQRIITHCQRLNNLEAEGFKVNEACNILGKELLEPEGFTVNEACNILGKDLQVMDKLRVTVSFRKAGK